MYTVYFISSNNCKLFLKFGFTVFKKNAVKYGIHDMCTPRTHHCTGQAGHGKCRLLGKDDSCEILWSSIRIIYLYAPHIPNELLPLLSYSTIISEFSPLYLSMIYDGENCLLYAPQAILSAGGGGGVE